MENPEHEFISFLEGVYEKFGLDPLCSKLFAILFIEPKEISIDELSKRTGYSLASVSNKMRFMEGIGVAQRVKKPGTKKVFYYVEKDVIKIQMNKIESFSKNLMGPTKELLPKMIEKYKDKKLDEESKKKLEIIQNYSIQIQKLEKAVEHMKEYLQTAKD